MAPPPQPPRNDPEPLHPPAPSPALRLQRQLWRPPRSTGPPKPSGESSAPESQEQLNAASPPQDAPPPVRLPFSSHPPVLRPWRAVTLDPETTGNWGNQHPVAAETHRPTNRRLTLLGLAVAAPLGAIVVWHSVARSTSATVTPPPFPVVVAPPPVAPADLARQAAVTARAFLATTTLDARARFVRHPEIARSRMQTWHAGDRPLRPLEVTSFHDRWAEERVGPHSFVMLYMEMADFTTRAIALERHPDGHLLVDWESFEHWSEMPWIDFLNSTPTEPHEFRVIVERDTYYNFDFTDADAWLSFRLTDPANHDYAYGYCRPDSDAAHDLGHLLRRQRRHGTTQAKAILLLRFPNTDPSRRQMLVESLVQDNWLKPNP